MNVHRLNTFGLTLAKVYGNSLIVLIVAAVLFGAFGSVFGLTDTQAQAIAGPVLMWAIFSIPVMFLLLMNLGSVIWASFYCPRRFIDFRFYRWQFHLRLTLMIVLTLAASIGCLAVMCYLIKGLYFSLPGVSITLAVSMLFFATPWLLVRFNAWPRMA